MTLHEAIELVLKEQQRPMTAREIADEINDKLLYRRHDGMVVPANQIYARVNRYKNRFLLLKDTGKVALLPSINKNKLAEDFAGILADSEKYKTELQSIVKIDPIKLIVFMEFLFIKIFLIV